MPATLRPHLLAAFILATTVCVSGCIFPFTRSSGTKLDALVSEEPAPPPQQQLQAPQAKVAAQTPAKKQLPPFARFIGGFFGGSSSTESANQQPEPVEAMPETYQLPNQVATERPEPAAEITPAEEVVSAPVKTPVFHPKGKSDMPVIVAPTRSSSESNSSSNTDLVSRFTQKISGAMNTQNDEVEPSLSMPSLSEPTATIVNHPSLSKPTTTIANTTSKPAAKEQIDAYARTPWPEKSLLDKAKANSSTRSTTLTHSLDLALKNVQNKEPAEKSLHATSRRQYSVAESKTPEVTATPTTTAPTTQSFATQPLTPTAKTAPAATTPTARTPTSNIASNPLRNFRYKTDWSGNSTRSSTPQTITNNAPPEEKQTVASNAQTATPAESETKQVASAEKPAAEPQMTVNPYADKPATSSPADNMPKIVANNNDTHRNASNNESSTHNEILFEASLLGKLQAANQQAAWNFDQKPAGDSASAEVASAPTVAAPQPVVPTQTAITPQQTVTPTPTVTPQQMVATTPQPRLPAPQVVENHQVETAVPQIAATRPQPTEQLEQTTPVLLPCVSSEEPVARLAPIKPFVIPAPVETRPAVVRKAEPAPQVIDSPTSGSLHPATSEPNLAPVVRMDEYNASASGRRGTKTYFVQ